MALTVSANRKRKSGRKIASLLLASSLCRCGAPGWVTRPKDTKRGTRWVHYCHDCDPGRSA